eukprot:gene12938-14268_t
MNRRRTSNLSHKEQVELLFDEIYNISCQRKNVKKSPDVTIASHRDFFSGADVVADSKNRLSGSFGRGSPSHLMARGHEPEEIKGSSFEQAEGDEPVRDVGAEAVTEEGPSEEAIQRIANRIANMGDEMDEDYKKKIKNVEEKLVDKLNNAGQAVTYEVFSKILNDIIAQDADANTFQFVISLSWCLFSTLGLSFVSHLKQYISERFSDEGASMIKEQQAKMNP